MKAILFNRSLGFAILFVLAEALHAQTCAGGAGGGMDATGNECNDARPQMENTAGQNTARIVAPAAANVAAPKVSTAMHASSATSLLKGTTLREPIDTRRLRRVSPPQRAGA